jgi:hypothetical protein
LDTVVVIDSAIAAEPFVVGPEGFEAEENLDEYDLIGFGEPDPRRASA